MGLGKWDYEALENRFWRLAAWVLPVALSSLRPMPIALILRHRAIRSKV